MRVIDSVLQEHLEQDATTECQLLKITCTDGDVFAFSGLDADVRYDDLDGLQTYVAHYGMEVSNIASEAGLGVDNAEASMLFLFDVSGAVTAEQIEAGKFDYAEYVLYLVNYMDLTAGRHVVLSSGTIGQIRTVDGQTFTPELRSLSQQTKQTIGDLTSVTCRTKFGSAQCGVDAEALWETHTVTTVGAEADRQFSSATITAATGFFTPGLVQFLTGDNAGKYVEVEDNTSIDIALRFPTRKPIALGDTFRIRPDCKKRFLEDCIGLYDNALNFRGEPNLPLGDEGQLNAPGGL